MWQVTRETLDQPVISICLQASKMSIVFFFILKLLDVVMVSPDILLICFHTGITGLRMKLLKLSCCTVVPVRLIIIFFCVVLIGAAARERNRLTDYGLFQICAVSVNLVSKIISPNLLIRAQCINHLPFWQFIIPITITTKGSYSQLL